MEWKNLTYYLETKRDYLDRLLQADYDGYDIQKSTKFVLNVMDTHMEIEFHTLDYYIYIENGRKPGGKFPPKKAIENWITRRRIVPYPMKNGKTPSKEELVFLIRRKIARDGIEPRPFYGDAIKNILETTDFDEGLSEAITNDIQMEIDEFLQPFGKSEII